MSDNSEKLKDNIPTFSSEKLCQFVVCYRYLNYDKDLAISAMGELAKRRNNGDKFDFESYIEESLSTLPKITVEALDIRNILNTAIIRSKK